MIRENEQSRTQPAIDTGESPADSEQLRAVFEQLFDAAFIHDHQGNLLNANRRACESLGYRREELLDLKVWELGIDMLPLDELQELWRKIANVEPAILETLHKRKDGSTFPVELRLGPIEHAGEMLILVIARDLTEQRQAEAAMRKLEVKVRQAKKLESLGILAGGIAHDFNNLLMGVMGNVSLLLEGLPQNAPTRPLLEDIELAAKLAADLCRQMLAYSGRSHFAPERLDLSTVIHEMAHLLHAAVPRSTTLQIDLDQDLPPIDADCGQIRLVIMNLIVNASEAMEDQRGVINVTTRAQLCDHETLRSAFLDEDLPEGSYAVLEITDDGKGMDERTKARIFDPFFSTKFTGRGLGLAAVLGIVRGHHGAINVTSAPGEGASIRVLLPTIEAEETATETRDCDVDFKGSGTMLLVDDDSVALSAAKLILEQLGFDVLTATNGREALDAFKSHQGELAFVLLDLAMPEMDGEETFYELLTLAQDIRVIIASGYDRHDVVRRFADRNPKAFIQKPYKLAELQKVLHKILA